VFSLKILKNISLIFIEHSEEIQEMEAALERLAKRDKILAEQNKDLMKRNDLLTQEFDNLKKELDRLKGEGDVSGNQEFD
jgi:predicted RNase H-like nuclease (RuvC/YqgF family)